MKSPEIEVNNEVLRWARDSIGYSIEDIARKTGISPKILTEWETKTSKIRYSDVIKLAKVVKRATVALLLNKPPIEPAPPEYFRRSGEKGVLSPEVRVAVRKAKHLQHISKSLEENMHAEIKPMIQAVSLNDSPEKIAERERTNIGITLEMQLKWKDSRKALRNFRNSIEEKNIFVFQMKMPIDKVQGFSLMGDTATVIVLNSSDIFERRIFTLFHEYAHILLGKTGICADIDVAMPIEPHEKIEKWCNRFAGSFLVPKEELSNELSENKIEKITYNTVESLAKLFSVSKHMIFVRLRLNSLIKDSDATELSKIFKNKIPGTKMIEKTIKKEAKEKRSAPPQNRRCISEKGKKFVSLVLENEKRGQITTAEALGYLSLRLTNLPKVEAALKR